ncbi:MAG: hypothetical protein MUP90_02955 [Gammaproteobacteria bacterium]|nr:hypothetical protein [Gammaproteobacteria bacterium]
MNQRHNKLLQRPPGQFGARLLPPFLRLVSIFAGNKRASRLAPLSSSVSLANVITITKLLVDAERELEETGSPV